MTTQERVDMSANVLLALCGASVACGYIPMHEASLLVYTAWLIKYASTATTEKTILFIWQTALTIAVAGMLIKHLTAVKGWKP